LDGNKISSFAGIEIQCRKETPIADRLPPSMDEPRRRRFSLFFVIVATAAIGLTTAPADDAWAQEQSAPPPSYETTVSAPRPPSLAEPPPAVPANVQVMDRAQIESSGAGTLGELLETLGGVEIEDEQGNGIQADVMIRGVPASPVTGLSQGVSVFVDGVRVNEPTVGEVNFDLVPLADVERIIVVRGPGALSGSGALAGAIYLITRRGTGAALEASAGAGRFGLRQARVRAAGARGVFDGYLSAGYLTQDGFRRLSASRVAQLFGKIGYGGALGDLTLSYQLQSDRIQQPGSLPATLLATDRDANFSSGDYFDPTLQQLTLNGQAGIGGGVFVIGNGFVRSLDVTQFNASANGADTRLRTRTRTGGGTLALLHRRAGPVVRNELRVGADAVHGSVAVTVVEEPLPLPPGCDPVQQDCPGAQVGAALADSQNTLGFFAHEMLELGPALLGGERSLTFSVGLRGERVSHEVTDDTPSSPGEAAGSARFSRLLPGAGLRFDVSRRLAVSASYAEGFRAPTFLELTCGQPASPCVGLQAGVAPDTGFSAQRPVRARNYELDLHAATDRAAARAAGADAEIDLAFFRLDLVDDIFSVSPNGQTDIFFQNIPHTRRQGAELRARASYRRFMLRFTYALTQATFETPVSLASPRTPGTEEVVPAGARLPLVPLHTASAHLSWSPAVGVTLSAALRYVGPSFFRGDEANTQPMLPGYWVAAAAARVERGRWWGSLRVTNLFNRKYETFGTYATASPGGSPEPFLSPAPPIDVAAQLGYRFP
jgi:iron complex outermembrane receptor protein